MVIQGKHKLNLLFSPLCLWNEPHLGVSGHGGKSVGFQIHPGVWTLALPFVNHMTTGKSDPQIFLPTNGDDNRTFCRDLLWGLNKIVKAKKQVFDTPHYPDNHPTYLGSISLPIKAQLSHPLLWDVFPTSRIWGVPRLLDCLLIPVIWLYLTLPFTYVPHRVPNERAMAVI